MKHGQTVTIIALIFALAGAVGWALAERSARQRAREALILQILNSSDRNYRQDKQIEDMQQRLGEASTSLQQIESSVSALEKWRNRAEERIAAAERRPDGPRGLFRGMERVMPGAPVRGMALDGRRTQRFSLKDKQGNAVNVSLMGAARVDEELAREMGVDAARRDKVNKLIREENRRWAEKLLAARKPGPRHGLDFGLGGGDDGWVDFANGAKMKQLLDAKARKKLLERFPRRSTMHLVTTGAGGLDVPHVRIHPRRERPDRPIEPPAGKGGAAPPPEQF